MGVGKAPGNGSGLGKGQAETFLPAQTYAMAWAGRGCVAHAAPGDRRHHQLHRHRPRRGLRPRRGRPETPVDEVKVAALEGRDRSRRT